MLKVSRGLKDQEAACIVMPGRIVTSLRDDASLELTGWGPF